MLPILLPAFVFTADRIKPGIYNRLTAWRFLTHGRKLVLKKTTL
jgi:hypothetical protein